MADHPCVHNKRAGTAPKGAVYVGRGSEYGNPYELGKDGSREDCIEKFRRHVLPKLDVRPLIGKHLVCYCAPLPCHADLLLAAARALEDPRLRLDFSKAPADPTGKAHFEHWCMAEGCHCWGDFGMAGPEGKGRVYLCAAHRAQYLQAREQSDCQKQNERADNPPLPVKDTPAQGGLF
ncbi:DUF4326 domain-containing protein [uncultured Cohaesibacter sp.]|uniref:DUF4326 domain-containing protein n=1 Tax=uncultured Cohaesibacter sp. TaxID=1002546 RepID=UPI0029C6577A|nr:DUF4326 domain-containing protein [uncultured Cohaesibacter sp.]